MALAAVPLAGFRGRAADPAAPGCGPRASCNGLLHKCIARPGVGKRAHVLQVARRKATHVREGSAQVVRQPVDHLGAPALGCLPRQDVAPDLPIQQQHLAVDRQRGALLRGVDAAFQFRQPVGVALGSGIRPTGGSGAGWTWGRPLALAEGLMLSFATVPSPIESRTSRSNDWCRCRRSHQGANTDNSSTTGTASKRPRWVPTCFLLTG